MLPRWINWKHIIAFIHLHVQCMVNTVNHMCILWDQSLSLVTWLSRCPDYQGDLIIKVCWLSRWPDYQGVLIIKVTWLSRCADYQGILIIKVSWLSRCVDYQGDLIIKVCWLSRHPDDQGVLIIQVSLYDKAVPFGTITKCVDNVGVLIHNST